MELSTQRENTRFQARVDKRNDLKKGAMEPGGNRPDIRTDMTRQLKQELDTNGTTQQTSSQTTVQPAHHDVQGATDYAKGNRTGDEAKTDFETWDKGFRLWWDNVNVTEYDTLEADQILRLVILRRLMSEDDEGEQGADAMKKENLSKLYLEDFDNFILQTRCERDHSVRNTRLDAHKKALEVGPADVAFRVTLFATMTSPWSLARDELEWITHLFNAEYTMQKVRNMPASELAFNDKRIKDDIAARAILRKDVGNSQRSTERLNCIDMGYRSLNRLQSLHDKLRVLDPGLADKQASTAEYPILREPWEKSQSRIISAAELEGGGLRPRLRLHP
jgi:hypothetical protein